MQSPLPTETIECPLCSGAGKLKRTEVLDRLGVKDFARVAQLSAEEAFRLLQNKHNHEHQSAWARFETELAKRTAEIRNQHKDELRIAQSERDAITRRVEDCLREVAQLQARNQQLEVEMSKIARIGKREEMDFADEARTWPGIVVSEKLPRNGDFLLAYRDLNGAPAEPRMVIDNKDKATVTEGDIKKLIRDAKERHGYLPCSFAASAAWNFWAGTPATARWPQVIFGPRSPYTRTNCSVVGRPASLNSRSPSERFWLTTLLGSGRVGVIAAFGFFRAIAWGRALAAARAVRAFLFAMSPSCCTSSKQLGYSTCLGREVKGKHCEAIYC